MQAHAFIDVYIGPDTVPSGEYFTVEVVTEDILDSIGRSKWQMVLAVYDWSKVENWVFSVAERCRGENWEEMANKLAQHMHWEFQDYNPYGGST